MARTDKSVTLEQYRALSPLSRRSTGEIVLPGEIVPGTEGLTPEEIDYMVNVVRVMEPVSPEPAPTSDQAPEAEAGTEE